MYFGNVCPTGLPLPARLTVGRAPPCPDLKSLLPFQLLPSFGKMDHIHQATIGPAYGVATPLKRKHSSCGVCKLRFNSEMQATSHYSGSKHAKKLKALDVLDSKIKTSEPVAKETTMQILSSSCPQPCSSNPTTDSLPPPCLPKAEPAGRVPAGPLRSPADPSLSLRLGPEKEAEADRGVEGSVETEEDKAMRLLYCSLCKVAVNSASQLQAHNCGTKHKTMLEARNGDGAIKSFPRSGVKAKMAAPLETSTGLQNKTFHCEICDVHVNSDTQLKQHISSRRHKDRAAGKPAKPKFSPYIPTQCNQGLQAVRLALGKEQDLTKPLASCLLQRHLSAAAAAMATMSSMSSFNLRSASNSSPAPFQSRPLPQPLLHPATGSIGSTHGPVLFSPY